MTEKMGFSAQDREAPVAICAWKENRDSVRDAIELCKGLKDLDSGMKVLIKPNLVAWVDVYPYSPFGIITTSVVLERIIKVLKDLEVKSITVGDGCAPNENLGSQTHILFNRLGYNSFVERYGIRVVDFNEGEHERLKLGPYTLRITREVLASDFLINVPVLKTHELTKASLGFKNLKGILHPKSKKICHNAKHSVDKYILQVANRFYPNLTIIDGIYMLERGPLFTGRPYRSELIIAGRDMYSADLVGATLMGIRPSEVEHLALFAKQHGRSLDVKDIPMRGLSLAEYMRPLEILSPWIEERRIPESFAKQDLEGFQLPYPEVLCTGCTIVFPAVLLLILSANRGIPFNQYELLSGKTCEPSGNANKTFLMGNCCIAAHKKNSKIKEMIPISGCPPKVQDIARALEENGVKVNMSAVERFFRNLVKRNEARGYPREDYWLK